MALSHNTWFSSVLALVVYTLLVLAPSVASLCTFPDGTISLDDVPCKAEGNSSCCYLKHGDRCLTNNLCLAGEIIGPSELALNGIYWRGSCSDTSWQSGQCARMWSPKKAERVAYCGSGKYCCVDEVADCCNDTTVEKLNLGEPSSYAMAGNVKPLSGISSLAVSSSASTAFTSSLSTPAPDSTPTATEEQSKPRDNHGVVKIGVGVGVTLGVVLVGVVVGGFWFVQKLLKHSEERTPSVGFRRKEGPPSELETTSNRLELEMTSNDPKVEGTRLHYKLDTKRHEKRHEMP